MSVARHTAYNFAGAVVPLAVSLVTVPLYLKVIGLERYGLLAIFWTLLGFLGFLSLGMGPAVTQRLATMAQATDRDRSQLVWTALGVNLAMAVAGSLLVIVLARFYFDRLSATPAGLQAEVEQAIPWLGLALPLSMTGGVLAGALQGRQRFGNSQPHQRRQCDWRRDCAACHRLFCRPAPAEPRDRDGRRQFCGLAVARGLPVKGSPACQTGSPEHGRRCRGLAAYGGWMTVSNVIGPLMVVWDRFVIGAIIGSAAVAIYVVPFNFVWQILIVPAALTSALFPDSPWKVPSSYNALVLGQSRHLRSS